MDRILPAKMPAYLRRIELNYERAGDKTCRDLVRTCRYVIFEDIEYDNWNGGSYGHDLVMYLPRDQIRSISIDSQSELAELIRSDINKASALIDNEYVRQVAFELEDENDPNFQRSVPFLSRALVNPDSVPFWKPGLVRLFISHRDKFKADARALSTALDEYGISSFVAHDTIEPMSEWRREIMRGLETMEAMLIFLTDDFEESIWTNQEIGFALARSVPIISLKLGLKDPPGFISHVQALRGNANKPVQAAHGLFQLIGKVLGKEERLREALIQSFIASPSWTDAKERFDRLQSATKSLTLEEVAQIVNGFRENDQLYNSIYLTNKANRLVKFLNSMSCKEYTISGREINEVKTLNSSTFDLDDEIPF